jgi:hypothetical protein
LRPRASRRNKKQKARPLGEEIAELEEADEEDEGVGLVYMVPEDEDVEVEAMPPLCEVSPPSDTEMAVELVEGGGDKDNDSALNGGLCDGGSEDENEDIPMSF